MNRTRLLQVAAVAAIAIGIIALNAPNFMKKPSFTLAVGATNGLPLRIDESEEPFKARDIVDIQQGEASTLILTKDGNIYTGGDNMYGQLATGQFGAPRDNFRKVTFPEPVSVRQIDMVHKHALALSDRGDVWAWGLNISGQAGDGSRQDRNRPVKVLSGATDIAAGYRFSAAIRQNGELWAWGMQCDPNTPGLVELAEAFAHDVSVGGSYYDGAAQNSNVYCLEQENLPIASTKPRKIEAPVKFSAVSGGYGHLLMLADDQTAWGFGCNGWGQLGRGHAQNNGGARKVSRVAFPDGIKIAEIDAGFRHSLARDTNGNVWAWGHDLHGEPLTYKSNRADKPEKVKLNGKALRISAGHEASGILTADGFYAAGDNQQAQISQAAADKRQYNFADFQKMSGDADHFSLGYLRHFHWQGAEL